MVSGASRARACAWAMASRTPKQIPKCSAVIIFIYFVPQSYSPKIFTPSRSLSFRAKTPVRLGPRNLLLLSEKIIRDVSTALDMTKVVIFSRLSQFAPLPADTPETPSVPSPSGRSPSARDPDFLSSPPLIPICTTSEAEQGHYHRSGRARLARHER